METPEASINAGDNVQIPPLLYKYANWRNDFHKRLITHREIFFASPSRFNDPFDCAVGLSFDKMTAEQELQVITRVESSRMPNATREEMDEAINSVLALRPLTSQCTQDLINERLQKLISSGTGVFSLSEDPTNLLLWSHYADQHRGFCVGFDTVKLEEYFDELCEREDVFAYLHQVNYSLEYPSFNPGDLSDEEYFKALLTIKSKDWIYEKEWRYVLLDHADFKAIVDASCLSEVIVGCKMVQCDIDLIGKQLGKAGFKGRFLRAQRQKGLFGLALVPVVHHYW